MLCYIIYIYLFIFTYFIISSFSLKNIFSLFCSIKLYSLISEKSAKPNPLEILLYESYIILHDSILLYFFFKKEKSSSSLIEVSKLPIYIYIYIKVLNKELFLQYITLFFLLVYYYLNVLYYCNFFDLILPSLILINAHLLFFCYILSKFFWRFPQFQIRQMLNLYYFLL